MRGSIRASCSAPPFLDYLRCALPHVFVSADGHPSHLYPTPFGDADANLQIDDMFLRTYVPLRGQGNRSARVECKEDTGQLKLEDGYSFHSIGRDFHYSRADVI